MGRRIWLHVGLHKTGSSFIQATAARAADRLADAGVYFQRPPGALEGNYPEAWALQAGRLDPLLAYARTGFDSGATQVLLSAEDLSSLLIRPPLARALIAAVRDEFDAELLVAAYLRRPSAQFWSMISQLSRHGYYDVFHVLAQVLRYGYLRVTEPEPDDFFAPEWLYCIDHARHFERFRRRVPAAGLRLFDFDSESFPGEGLFRALGVEAGEADGEAVAARNPRRGDREVEEALAHHGSVLMPDSSAGLAVGAALGERQVLAPALRDAISAVIDERFAAGSRALLDRTR